MITLAKQIIKEHPSWLKNRESELSFMKMSTPSSGRKSGEGKVLIFIFEDRETIPTLCLKTVRSYKFKEIIKRDQANLGLIRRGIEGSRYEKMFAKPLFLYDQEEIIFSLETICPGFKFSSQNQRADLVINSYLDWQEHLAQTKEKFWTGLEIKDLASQTLKALGFSGEPEVFLQNYYGQLFTDNRTKLPIIVQHGDLTPDNVLVSGEEVYLIDYDYVGEDLLPGFDLFHFLSKFKTRGEAFRSSCEKHLTCYFEKIGAKITSLQSLFFVYYLQELKRKGCLLSEKSGESLIEDFKIFINRP